MVRRRKFRLGEIVSHWGRLRFVVVDWRQRDNTSEYRVVGISPKGIRRGTARWMRSDFLTATGLKSGTASVKTYRINEKLPDRGCGCQCCAHVAMPLDQFTVYGDPR